MSEQAKYGEYGRRLLAAAGGRQKYHHEFEHRGHGIVAIYSYGPAGEHEALVRSSRAMMRKHFGVSGAVSSGGVSGYPENRPTPDYDWQSAICETQTIFCIDAVGGPNRPRVREVAPAKADWHVAYVVDRGQSYLGDGEVNRYFTGPLEDAEIWEEKIRGDICDALGRDRQATVLELKVRALSQGRYWFLADGDPVAEVDSFEVSG